MTRDGFAPDFRHLKWISFVSPKTDLNHKISYSGAVDGLAFVFCFPIADHKTEFLEKVGSLSPKYVFSSN
jgi:hypothetical protein